MSSALAFQLRRKMLAIAGGDRVGLRSHRKSRRLSSRTLRTVSAAAKPAKAAMDPWSAAIIDQNRRWLSAYLLSITGNPGSVDDLVQECFEIAFRKRDSFKPGSNFGAWLRAIGRNVAMRHCEKKGRRPLVDHQEALDQLDRAAADAEAKSVGPDHAERRTGLLRECLATLTEKIRNLLDMRYNQGMSTIAIAERIGAKVPAVNTAIFRARMQLGQCIRAREAGGES
jgi:RNA polymerase sigma-70 factor